MGQLTEGHALTWKETKKLAQHVKEHGILQFINLYKKHKDRQDDELKWGDEIEYTLVKFDNEKKTAKLRLISHELLPLLNEKENSDPDGVSCIWRPEYGSYQIEGIPGQPYGSSLSDFNVVEANMRYRRIEAIEYLTNDVILMTLTTFPRMGCLDFSDPPAQPTPHSGSHASLFLPDEALFQGHDRWLAITNNLRLRRGDNFTINIPIYKDKNVATPFREDLTALGDDGSRQTAAKDDCIYMDALGFGMGSSCLQATFQAPNLQQARILHDQLTPLCPIMVALTAASPIYRGYVSDVDSRTTACIECVDDRTRGERGVEPLKEGECLMRTSRNGSTEWYISEQADKFNDVTLEYDEEQYNLLLMNGVDKILAQHVAHLFARDPCCLLSTQLNPNDDTETTFFENLQGAIWRSMRFKPPPPNTSIGWRVEFRPCDIQITDFENAAVVCFIALLTRIIMKYNLNFLIPLTKVDENMYRAQKRDAVNIEKFIFRKNILPMDKTEQAIDDEYDEFTVNEIINGKPNVFVGIIPLMNSYLESMDVDAATGCLIQRYLDLVQGRASGELMTDAAWIRKQVMNHPDYQKDSVVTELINYDLLKDIHDIQTGKRRCPEVFGSCAA